MADIDKPRRSFLTRIAALFGGLAALEAGWIATSFFGARRATKSSDNENELEIAGPIERFEPGSVTAFGKGHFYLTRLDDGGFLALHRKCTHLGCTVPWDIDERKFACPCHGSEFDIRGDVLSAPASRALDLFAVQVEDGVVKVDTRQPVRRRIFEPSQVAKA